jgi:hypothetical protein
MRESALNVTGAVADGFSTFLVGLGQQTIETVDGVEKVVRGRFHNAMIDTWRSIRQEIEHILSDILNYFLHEFIEGLIRGIAGARLGQRLGNAIGSGLPGGGGGGIGNIAIGAAESQAGRNLLGIGAGAGSSYVGAEVAGVAAATTTAATTGYVGSSVAATEATIYGGGTGFSLSGFLTNPYTAIGVGAFIAGMALYKHLTKGKRANDARDKDLAQFKGFDTAADREDTANPPGFHGLWRVLTKYKKGALFEPFVMARDHEGVKRTFAPIQAFFGSLGRHDIKSYGAGGFVPPGVIQPALVHGGMYGEDITPRGPEGSHAGGWQIVNHWHVSTIDANGIREFVQSGDFTYHLGNVIERNHGFLTTAIRRAV